MVADCTYNLNCGGVSGYIHCTYFTKCLLFLFLLKGFKCICKLIEFYKKHKLPSCNVNLGTPFPRYLIPPAEAEADCSDEVKLQYAGIRLWKTHLLKSLILILKTKSTNIFIHQEPISFCVYNMSINVLKYASSAYSQVALEQYYRCIWFIMSYENVCNEKWCVQN